MQLELVFACLIKIKQLFNEAIQVYVNVTFKIFFLVSIASINSLHEYFIKGNHQVQYISNPQ